MKVFTGTVKETMLTAGISEQDYRRVADERADGNQDGLRIFTFLSAIFLAGMFLASFFLEFAADKRPLYATVFLVMVLLNLICGRSKLKESGVIACIYVFMGTLLGFGILMGTLFTPDEQGVTFVALLIAAPLLFTDRPVRMCAFIICAGAVYVACAAAFDQPQTMPTDAGNAVIFTVISCVLSTYMMQVRSQSLIYHDEARYLSRTDVLTGLLNRNCFEHDLPQRAQEDAGSLTVVYVDVNGLHALNDTQGHEAGDRMLRSIAEALRETFPAGAVYRIGGDEFVVLDAESNAAKLDAKLAFFEAHIAAEGYCAAVGYATQALPIVDAAALLKAAEQHMYAAKNRYYEQSGIDRRVV